MDPRHRPPPPRRLVLEGQRRPSELMSPAYFRPQPLEILLAKPGPYSERFAQHLNQIHPDLATRLHELPSLDPSMGRHAVAKLLEFACQAQNIANIELGRAGLLAVPFDWLVAKLPPIARKTLDLSDEWELRRLLEVLCVLDRCLMLQFAEAALRNSDGDIREAAQEMIRIAARRNKDAPGEPWA